MASWDLMCQAPADTSIGTGGECRPPWYFHSQWHGHGSRMLRQGRPGQVSACQGSSVLLQSVAVFSLSANVHLRAVTTWDLVDHSCLLVKWCLVLQVHQHLLEGTVWPEAGTTFSGAMVHRMDSERCRVNGITTVALGGSSDELGWRGLDVVHQFSFTCCDGYPLFFRASAMCLVSLSLSGTYVPIVSAWVISVLVTAALFIRG